MEAVEQFIVCLEIVQHDLGAETVVGCNIQAYLPCRDGDGRSGEQSHIAGTSTTNQQTESWQVILCKEGSGNWIQLLSQMKDDGLLVTTWTNHLCNIIQVRWKKAGGLCGLYEVV